MGHLGEQALGNGRQKFDFVNLGLGQKAKLDRLNGCVHVSCFIFIYIPLLQILKISLQLLAVLYLSPILFLFSYSLSSPPGFLY